MEPISIIVSALALGAAAGLKASSEQAFKDSYAVIKSLIMNKYLKSKTHEIPFSRLSILEGDPASQDRQKVVADDLKQLEVDKDTEIINKALDLINLIQERAPEIGADTGIKLENITGKTITIKDVKAPDSDIVLTRSHIDDNVLIEGCHSKTIEISHINMGQTKKQDSKK